MPTFCECFVHIAFHEGKYSFMLYFSLFKKNGRKTKRELVCEFSFLLFLFGASGAGGFLA